VITVFAESARLDSIHAEAAEDCGYERADGGIPVPAPADLNLGGRRSIACRTDGSTWINLLVEAECGVPTLKPHSPRSICSAWLHSTSKFFKKDLETFRATIATIRFFKPHD
jgi:hypothetical protein